MTEGAQYCSNCGNPVDVEQTESNENSFQNNNNDKTIWELLVDFLKVLRECMKDTGGHIISTINKVTKTSHTPNGTCSLKIQYFS